MCQRKSLLPQAEKKLPEGFDPGRNDVLCGRGADCFNHIGNRRFRQVVEDNLELYASTRNKFEKSIMIHEIMNRMHFVRKDHSSGQFVVVSEFIAREKVSQAFRDAMAHKAKLSSAVKKNSLFDDISTRHKLKSNEFNPTDSLMVWHPNMKKLNTEPTCNTLSNIVAGNVTLDASNAESLDQPVPLMSPCSNFFDSYGTTSDNFSYSRQTNCDEEICIALPLQDYDQDNNLMFTPFYEVDRYEKHEPTFSRHRRNSLVVELSLGDVERIVEEWKLKQAV